MYIKNDEMTRTIGKIVHFREIAKRQKKEIF